MHTRTSSPRESVKVPRIRETIFEIALIENLLGREKL